MTAPPTWRRVHGAIVRELERLRAAADAESRDLTEAESERCRELEAGLVAAETGDWTELDRLQPEWSDPDEADEPGSSHPRASDLRRQLEDSTRGPSAAERRQELEAAIERSQHVTSPGAQLRKLERLGARTRDDLRGIAAHEAGHAVIGEASGSRVACARFTFGPNGGVSGGATPFEGSPSAIAIAGGEAFARATGSANRLGDHMSSVDRDMLRALGYRTSHAQELCVLAGVGVLRRPGVFAAAQRVAAELLELGEVPGARVRQILSEEMSKWQG